jgi:hypothetical protein
MTPGNQVVSGLRAQNDAGCDAQASTPLPDIIFHFQAWCVSEEPVSECIRDNETLASLIESSGTGNFSQILLVEPSQPKLALSTVVPVSVR